MLAQILPSSSAAKQPSALSFCIFLALGGVSAIQINSDRLGDFVFTYEPYVLQKPFFANNQDEEAWRTNGGKDSLKTDQVCRSFVRNISMLANNTLLVCDKTHPDGSFHDTLHVRGSVQVPMESCKSLEAADSAVVLHHTGSLQAIDYTDINPAPGPEAVADLLGYDSWSFQHFLDGPALRIAQNYKIYKKYNSKLLLQVREGASTAYNNPLVPRMVAKAGFGDHEQAYCGTWNTAIPCVEGPRSVNISLGCTEPPFHPSLASKFRKLMGVHDVAPLTGGMLVLSSRNHPGKGGVFNHGRKVTNEAQVEDLCKRLADEYHLKYEKASQPIEDSVEHVVEYFGKVKLLVGPHGGALYNSWFMPRDSGLIELAAQGNSYFWPKAARFGQRYGVIYSSNFGGKNWWSSDMTVNVVELEILMRKILDDKH